MTRKGGIIANIKGRPEAKKDEVNINDAIRSPKLRVIDEEGNQLGIISKDQALAHAERVGLDLVEVSPNAEPPVCKVMDYGKYRFQQQKKASEARKKQVKVTVKEIAIRPQTEEHDYQIKLKKVFQFLGKGDKVRINLRFRGREIAHKDLGFQMLERIVEDTKDIAKVDQMPKMEGRVMVLLLSPDARKK